MSSISIKRTNYIWNGKSVEDAPSATKAKSDKLNKNSKLNTNNDKDKRLLLNKNKSILARSICHKRSRNSKNLNKFKGQKHTDYVNWSSFVHKNCHKSLPLLLILGCNLMTYGTENFGIIQNNYTLKGKTNINDNNNKTTVDQQQQQHDHHHNQASEGLNDIADLKFKFKETHSDMIAVKEQNNININNKERRLSYDKSSSFVNINEIKSLTNFINSFMEFPDIFPIKPVQAIDNSLKCTGCDSMGMATILKLNKPPTETTRDLMLRRLKRGFRSRPKLTTRIFNKVSPILKKVSPTKVLIGSHLGTLAYRKYTNYTNSLNNNSTNVKNTTAPAINDNNSTVVMLNDTLPSTTMMSAVESSD